MKTEAPSATPTNGPDPIPDRPAASVAPSRSAGLLSLVHGLIAFGQALLHTLQSSPAAEALAGITSRFGTHNLALIIARITRGLMLAANLDARLVRSATRLDTPPARPVAVHSTARRKRCAPTQPLTQQADDAALLARLPTAQEIAARLRGKPIGVVLEEICQDLGITCGHPLWRQLNEAMLFNGGRLPRVFKSMWRRVTAGYVPPPPELLTAAMPYSPFAVPSFAWTGTGPP